MLAITVLAGLLRPASADAYSYIVRPDATFSTGSWTVSGGLTAHEVLADDVRQPTAPNTAFGFIEDHGNGPSSFEIGLGTIALRPGETVTRVRGRAYMNTGDARTFDGEIRTGASTLAFGSWPSNAPAAWTYLDFYGALTQPQLDDLRLRGTLQGSGASSATHVYASYAVISTDMPPPDPTITGGPSGAGTAPTVAWSFTAAPAAGFQCRLERDGALVSDWAACSSGQSWNLGATGDGDYTFRVRAIDDADLEGGETVRTYRLDRGVPAAPTVVSPTPSPGTVTAPSWSFTGEGGSTLPSCRLRRGATVVSDWTLCTSPASFGTLADGAYTFEVRDTDLAGNVGPEGTGTYTVDTTKPAPPTLTASPPTSGQSTTPSWSFTAEAGAAVTCRLERGTTVISDWASCPSPRSFDLSGAGDGTYSFRVRATDAAGNESDETPGTYTLDRVAPSPPTITSGPSGPTNGSSPSFGFTAEAGAATECRLMRGATLVSDWAPCVSPRQYTALQSDGAYDFDVRATDAAGNVGAAATRSFTLDRVAPNAPVITGGSPAASSDPAPTWSFSQEALSTASCRLERGGTVVSDWTPCSSPRGYDLTNEPDGAYTFRVRTTDQAGNTSPISSRGYTLDRVAPPAPAIGDRPPAVTNTNTPTYSWPPDPDIVSFRCRLERAGTPVYDWTTCTSPRSFDLTNQPDGTYMFRLRGSDVAANDSTESTDTFALDRVAPAAPAITSGPTGLSTNAMPSYAFTAEAGAALECRLDRGSTAVRTWAPCVSPRSYDLTLDPDGTYTFRVRATDAAGNTSADGTRAYTLDRTAPAPPVVTSGPPADTNDPQPSYGFTGEPGATFECRLSRAATEVHPWAACSTPQSYNLISEADGTYLFEVRATDAAGNTGNAGTRTAALDRVAPPAPTVTAGPGAATNANSPSWSFTTTDATGTSCRLERGGTVVSDWTTCSSPRAYNLTSAPDGTYTFLVRAFDAAGNVGTEAQDVTDVDRAAPAAPAITGGPDADSPDPSPTYTFTAEAGATTACRVERGSTVVSDWSSCSSPRTYALGPEGDGTYTFRVRATDPAGNTGAAAQRVYTLDRVAPVAPAITASPAADSVDDTPTYAFSAESGAAAWCRLDRGTTEVSGWSRCTSPETFALGDEADGTYTFTVRAVDAAGNTGAEATHTYRLDRVVPTVPVIDVRPGDDGNDQTPTWGFSGEPGRMFECRVERGTTVVDPWGPCGSPQTVDLSLRPDGTYTFSVRAYNAAGTRSPTAADAYRLDTSAPGAPVLSGGPAPDSTDDTPQWDIAAEPGAALECRLERGGAQLFDWAPCSTPVGYDLRSRPDDTYSLLVRATDAAQNVSATATATYTLDRTVPEPPAAGASPPAAGSDPRPSWSFTADPGRTFVCRVSLDGSPLDGWAACTSPYALDLTARPDGTYTFEVEAVNRAGTHSPALSDDYVLDRVAPGAPAIDSAPPADTADPTPTWEVSTEAGAQLTCRVERGSAVIADWVPCANPISIDLRGEPDGAYTFRVRATDPAGNTGSATSRDFTLDRTVPGAPSITGRPTSPSADRSPTWTLARDGGLSLECRLTTGTTEVAGWAPCSDPHTRSLASAADGAYTLHVRQFNAAGTRGAEVTDDFVLDTTAPAAPTISARPGDAGNGNAPQWTFAAEPGAAVTCRLERGDVVVRDWGSCSSPRAYGLAGEPDGGYRFLVRATDAAGNIGASAVDDHRLDRVPPAPPAVTGGPGPLGNARAVAWSFTAEAGALFECRFDADGSDAQPFAACSTPQSVSLADRPDGAYAFGVRAVDDAGNRSDTTMAPYRLDTTPGAVRIDSGPGPLGRDRAPRWTYTAEEGTTVACRLAQGDVSVFDWAPCGMPATYDLSGRPDGVVRLSLQATDPAGNTGPVADASYELDTTPPAAPAITREPASPGTDRTPSWRFSGEAGATFACSVVPRGAGAEWEPCASPHTADLVKADDGDFRFAVHATDRAGNTGPASASPYALRPEPKEAPAPPVRNDPPADPAPQPQPEQQRSAAPADEPEPAAAAKPRKPKAKPAPAIGVPSRPLREPSARPRMRPETSATPAAPAPRPAVDRGESGGDNPLTSVGKAIGAGMRKAASVLAEHPDKSVFPMSLILVVILFLAVQNRIDRGDPKLALAPVEADPDLEFTPPPARPWMAPVPQAADGPGRPPPVRP